MAVDLEADLSRSSSVSVNGRRAHIWCGRLAEARTQPVTLSMAGADDSNVFLFAIGIELTRIYFHPRVS